MPKGVAWPPIQQTWLPSAWRTERLLPTPGGPKIMSRFRCPAAKAQTYCSNSAKLDTWTACEGRLEGLAMLGLLNHRQRDARCLFEQEELPRAREEIQENRAKLVGPGEVNVRPCTAACRERLYIINRVWLPIGCLKRDQVSRSQRLPSDPLLSPVGDDRDRQEVPEMNRVPAFESAWQEKDLLLQIGSEG